jgi:hypothetical protein
LLTSDTTDTDKPRYTIPSNVAELQVHCPAPNTGRQVPLRL